MTIEHIIALISGILGLLAALPKVRDKFKWLWVRTLGRRGAQLDRIEKELRPNGDSSMRDAIDRIEDRQYDFDAFLSATLNTEKEAIFRTDAKGSLYAINRAHQRLLGYSLAEMEGDGWKNCVHPDDREKIVRQWEETVNSKMELNEDIKFLHADGHTLLAHANVYREIDSNGVLRGYLGVIRPAGADELVCPHLGICAVNAVTK